MSKLIYVTNMSLDGYIEDKNGAFDWANPDQVFDFITELIRPIGTHVYGRRLYETMVHWDAEVESYPSEHRDFARVWQNAKKIVFSRTLTGSAASNTVFERDFNIGAVRKLKQRSEQDIFIGGAELAGLAMAAEIVDECHLFIHPVVVGGGKPALQSATRRNLELLETRRFDAGALYMRYRTVGDAGS